MPPQRRNRPIRDGPHLGTSPAEAKERGRSRRRRPSRMQRAGAQPTQPRHLNLIGKTTASYAASCRFEPCQRLPAPRPASHQPTPAGRPASCLSPPRRNALRRSLPPPAIHKAGRPTPGSRQPPLLATKDGNGANRARRPVLEGGARRRALTRGTFRTANLQLSERLRAVSALHAQRHSLSVGQISSVAVSPTTSFSPSAPNDALSVSLRSSPR